MRVLKLALLSLALCASTAIAQTSVANGVYTEEEATRGQTAYASACASCHGRALVSTGDAPGLTGEPFAFGWKGQTLAERFERIKETMPPNNPNTLKDELIRDVIAYILKFNKYPAGATALPSDAAGLGKIMIPK